MPESSWRSFECGATVGQRGSEGGAILRDEEHALGARITLERDAGAAPFTITCGIYGTMMHTRFFGSESEAAQEYERMKESLDGILERASGAGDADGDDAGRRSEFFAAIEEFVRSYP